MTNNRTHRPLTAILADLDDFTIASTGTKATILYHELEDAVRAQLAPLPEGEAERMMAEADQLARTMAPPVPGVTRNGNHTVRAVIYMHPHQHGLLETWVVAAEDTERGAWVTWNAYALDHPGKIGQLAYDAGHYFDAPSGPSGLSRADNRRRALADLAVRAGLMPEMALRIADMATQPGHDSSAEDKRMARHLRRYFAR